MRALPALRTWTIVLAILFLLLLMLLPLAAAPLRAGTIERLGDLDPDLAGRTGFVFDRFGTVLGTVGEGAGERLLVCLGGDRASLWTFGATPESAQPIGGNCPRDNTVVPLAGDGGAPTFVYVAYPDEVWRTDGTPAGTFQLLPRSPLGARPVTIVGRGRTALLFFDDRFLSTDGTVAGTREVARFEDFFLGAERIGDAVVFAAGGANYTTDLWRTDGTAAGTRRLARIQDYSFIDPLVPSGDRVFVLLQGSLWVTDGSEVRTRRAIASWSAYGIYPSGLRPIGYRGGIAFEAERDALPNQPPPLEIWWSDGTPRGTRRLAALPTNQLYSPERFRVLGSRLLLTVESELWTSDGTAAGTGPLAGCRGGCPRVYAVRGVELDGALLLRAGDDERGFELWRTDGTGRGTRMVREVCPGACGFIATDLVPWRGGIAYLAADGPFQDAALWSSDGTAKGTIRRAALGDELISNDGSLVEGGGRLYQMLNTRETGWQLWTLDGTPGGTLPLTRQLGVARADGELVRSWARPDGGVFVVARAVLSSDGTRAGTRTLAAPSALSFVGTIGDAGIAQRNSESGEIELLRLAADGSEPTVFAELPPGQWILGAIPFRGGLALDVHCGCGFGKPDELWVTYGTAAGTTRRLTFPNLEASFAGVDGDVLYFTTGGSGTGGGSILWRSDGSEAGTVALAQRPGMSRRLVRAGDQLFFVAAGRSFGPELWRTDGTPAGTRPYFDDGGPREPRDLFAFDGALFFAAAEVDGEEDAGAVWRLDPSTGQLTALGSFATVGAAWTFAAAGGHLFFTAAETAFGGSSLYATDGTVAGTVRVAALSPPGDPVYPPLPAPVALGDRLLFTALDLAHGSEPWTSDGTVAGTRLLRDLVPGAQGSLPSGWVAAGGRAFFGAGDGVRAAGLFVYDPARVACASDGERLCLGGRWEAEAAFPALDDYFAAVPAAVGTSLGPASALFAHPSSGEPRLVLRASTGAGGTSVAAAGLTREWWIATVTDTTNGEARRYVSLPGLAVRFDDRAAFPSDKGTVRRASAVARPLAASSPGASSAALRQPATAPCSPGPTTACLLADRFSVRGHRGNQPATLSSIGDELALIVWPTTTPSVTPTVDPDAALRIVPRTGGGHEVFFAALAPAQGAAVVRARDGRTAVYPNLAGTLTLVDDPTTFAPR